MAGIGDSWGTADELAHPRDSHGRWRSKWKLAPEAFRAVIAALGPFSPRTFQSDSQATQYNQNLAHLKPGRFGGGRGYSRLIADFHNANNDLLDGNPDEPSTKKFVQMMDASMIELPDDVIVAQVVGPDAFGLTPERLPELENFTNTVIANRGYSAVNMGTPLGGGNGAVTLSIAVPKGTKAAVPGTHSGDRSMFLNRDQELTVTKVKPDGRGGYFMWAVATPKTAGENPGPVGGLAGPGHAGDREKAVKGLQEAGNQRLLGEQGASQLPGGAAAGGLPEENGKVVGAAPSSPEADRATRRAAILGRPASSEAAPQQAQPEAAAPAAPTPTAPAEPGAPSAPLAPEANVPETPPSVVQPPNGATSVVTGDPATSFRDAVRDADLEAPSPGSRRKEWNNAYVGITSGKKHPEDMLRELEADIANNKQQQSKNGRDYDYVLGGDIEKQEKLADLIRSHFTLGEPKQRQASNDVRKDLEAKDKAGRRPPTIGGTQKRAEPASADKLVARKAAPPRKDTVEQRTKALGEQVGKDASDDALNDEQRQRWSDEVGVSEPKQMKGQDTAGNILLDETADLLRNGRVTRPKAIARLREHAGEDDTPEANYLRKVADAIEGDTSKPNKRVPLKKAAPRAAADVDAAEKALAGRTEKNILTGLNGQSVGNLRALAEKWGVETRGEDKKLKLKAALAKELAAKWKATPSLQRKAEGAPEVPVKKVAKAAVKAAAPEVPTPAKKAARAKKPTEQGLIDLLANLPPALPEEGREERIRDRPALTEDDLREMLEGNSLRQLRSMAGPDGRDLKLPAKATKKQLIDALAPLDAADSAAAREARMGTAKQEVVDEIKAKATTPVAKKLAAVATTPEVPEVIKEAAAKAVTTEAEFKGKKTISTSRLTPGTRILAEQNADGQWISTSRKRGSTPIAVTRVEPGPATSGHQRSYIIHGKDDAGNDIQLRGLFGQNVVHLEKPSETVPVGIPTKGPSPSAIVPRVRPEADPNDHGGHLLRSGDGLSTSKAPVKKTAPATVAAPPEAAPDPIEQMLDGLPDTPSKPRTKELVREVRAEVETSSNPKGVGVEERVAVRLMAKIAKQDRAAYERLMANMPEVDRNHLLDAASKMGLEDLRVRKGGFDLDRIMSDAGIKPPKDSSDSRAGYDMVRAHLAAGQVERAKTELKRQVELSQMTLRSYRAGLDTPGQTQKNKEMLNARITDTLAHGLWAESALAQLSKPDATPELTPKKELIDVVLSGEEGAALQKATAKELREGFKAMGVDLPQAARTKDQVIQEVGREIARREMARRRGETVPDLTPTPPPVAAKKAVPKAPAAPIDVRTLVPDQLYVEAPGAVGNDSAMLDRIQKMLDGDPDALRQSGLPKSATPAAVGRWLESWSKGAGSPGWAAATNTIAVDGAKRAVERATTYDDLASAKAHLADVEANTQLYRAQGERWKALAAKLKTTRRTSVKATPVAAPEAPAPAPVKKVLARAAAPAPAKKLTKAASQNLSTFDDDQLKKITESPEFSDDQKELVAQELANRAQPAKKVTKKAAAAAAAEAANDRTAQGIAYIAQGGFREDAPVSTQATKDEREARDKVKQTQEAFDRLEERANRVPEGDESEPDPVLENELEIARDERDQAEDDLAGLRAQAAKKVAKKAAPVEKQVETRRARKEVQAEVAKASDQEVEAAITDAYANLKKTSSRAETVRISALREKLGDKFTREEVDAALGRMNRTNNLFAEPESDQKNLTDKERADEIVLGNQRKHTITMPNVQRKSGGASPAEAPVKATKTAVKKAAPAAAPANDPSRQELMDMSPGELKDVEDDLGIERKTLHRGDRVDAIMAARAAKSEPAPAKKAATKAAKAVPAPAAASKGSPNTPGPAVRDASVVITGNGTIVKRERPKTDEPIHLPNGGADQGLMHLDSEMGKLWADLYMDDRAPNSFINEIARMGDDMGRDKLGLSQFIERLKVMKKDAVDKGVADRIQEAIDATDAPPVKLDIPESTPPVLRKALEDLADIPTARMRVAEGVEPWRAPRIGGRALVPGEPSLVEKKLNILQRFLGGDPEFLRGGSVDSALGNHDFHESGDAATTMWHIMDRALQDPTVQKWLREKTLELRKNRRD